MKERSPLLFGEGSGVRLKKRIKFVIKETKQEIENLHMAPSPDPFPDAWKGAKVRERMF
jgi:hypothetical protein